MIKIKIRGEKSPDFCLSKNVIMNLNRTVLLDELEQLVLSQMNEAELLKTESDDSLLARPHAESWNALECYEHLNLYAQFYVAEISKRLAIAKQSNNEIVTPGYIGNTMLKSCMPDAKRKIKTFRTMNTLHKSLTKEVLDEFISHQKNLLILLEQARKVDLNKVKTNISISKWLKLRLGDVLRFVVYHQERHKLQAQRAIKSKLN